MITGTSQTGNPSFPGHLQGFDHPGFRRSHLVRLVKTLGLQASEDATKEKLVALLRANNVPETGNNTNPDYWEADQVAERAEIAALREAAKAAPAAVEPPAETKRGPGRPAKSAE